MTPKQYAGRMGVSRQAVEKAVKTGRLDKSITRDARGRVTIDPKVADLEWERLTDPTRTSAGEGEGEGETFLAAKTRRERAAATKAEIELAALQGELVRADDVKKKLEEVFTSCKQRLLAIPTRAKQQLPHLAVNDIAAIEELIREACEDLAEGRS